MEEVIIIAILLWLRGGKTESTPAGSGGGSGGAGGASGSGGSGGTVVTTTMTPSLTDKPTPTSGIGYRPTPSPTVPYPPVYQPPAPQVPQIVTPMTPPTPVPVAPPTPPPQVRDPRTPPGPTLVPGWDDGRPAFCGREWIPLELTACAPGRDNPLPRTGTPPPGTRVMAYAPPWSSAYYSSPSCPAQPMQGGIHYLLVGSPEWLQVCGPANPTQEI